MRRDPRDYQQAAHDAVWAELGPKVKSSVMVMPTGTGKTLVGAMVAETAKEDLRLRTLFLCNREILVHQSEATLAEHGLDVLVEMADRKAHVERVISGDPDVVVATVQTMHEKRLIEHWPRDYFGLIIQDECHHANSRSHRAVYDHFRDALHLGITATPGGGKMLGNIYESRCFNYKIRDAVRAGWLSPVHLKRVPIVVDLKGLSTIKGDFNAGDLSERISPKIEELADGIRRYVGGRYTVVFCPDVGCALAMAQGLSGLGVEARYVAGEGGRYGMHRNERRAVLKAFNRGAFQAVVCCDLLFEGWDAPHVSAVVNCRPTYKLYRFQQEVGRGTRPCAEVGKEDLLVIDFDWRTSSHARDLAHVADLFGGDLDERTRARVKAKVDEKQAKGEEVDFEAEVDEAERHFVDRDKMLIRLTGAKLRLAGEEICYDPIGVGNLVGARLVKRYDINTEAAGPATGKQMEMLRMLGVRDGGTLSKWGAVKLIKSLKDRAAEGLATPEQLAALRLAGVGDGVARVMRTGEAAEFLGKNLNAMEMFK